MILLIMVYRKDAENAKKAEVGKLGNRENLNLPISFSLSHLGLCGELFLTKEGELCLKK